MGAKGQASFVVGLVCSTTKSSEVNSALASSLVETLNMV